ncbi:hypothetical protein NFI96_009893 [Prochilodus magdalenae]|nr:hypothetical protein NFI96_009893 [Prochilodus magdalenae]
MSSLLENPLQAVLYLKELTAIVQNQQSLIQTQRHRIDALERRLGDLVVENRQLRDATHRHPARHHPPPPPRTSSLPRAPQQQHGTGPSQAPSAPTPPQHSPQDMQLVPASASLDSSPEDAREPCCRSLVPQSAGTLCRAVGIPRSSEAVSSCVVLQADEFAYSLFSHRSQTVLHQFCCPAPEAPEGESIGCSRSKVNAAVYQEVLEHFMLPAADQLYGDADFIFQQDLAPAHSAKATSTWFKDHGIPVLNNWPDLIMKRKMRYARPNNAEELKVTVRTTWAIITPEQCNRLSNSMPRRISAVIQAKGAPTKY